jgi:hypothetical protein
MKRCVLCPAMLVVMLTSCCAKDTGPKTEDRSPARPALSAEDSPGKASAKDASSHQREKKIVSARAFPTNKGDGGDAKPIEITLRLEGEEQVSGVLRLPGNPMELFGFRREGHLRLWVGSSVRCRIAASITPGGKVRCSFPRSDRGRGAKPERPDSSYRSSQR